MLNVVLTIWVAAWVWITLFSIRLLRTALLPRHGDYEIARAFAIQTIYQIFTLAVVAYLTLDQSC